MDMPNAAITKLLNDNSEMCANNTPRLTGALSYIVKVYFGLNPDNGNLDEVFALSTQRITSRFPELTFEQLNISFSEAETTKREGVSLTVDELCGPIASFVRKIAIIRESIKEETQKEENERIEKEAAEKFKAESRDLYLECLNGDKIWTGTEFQAHTFAYTFAERFTQKQKDEIWQESKREFFQRREAINQNDPFALPPPPPEKIFSRMIVEEALRQEMFVVVD